MENAGFFQTPVNLFYSRRIIEPQLGARLTGKMNRWAVGALVMDDRAPGALLSPDDAGHGSGTGAAVLRVQREFASQSSAGVLVTSRDFDGRSNRVAGFDTRLKLSPNWYFTGQMAGSDTREQDGRRASGQASLAQLDYAGRNFLHSTAYTDFSPSFGTDLGYVKRVDVRGVSDYASYVWYPRGKGLVSFGPSLSVSGDWDHRQVLQDWNAYPTFVLNFPRQTQLKVGTSETYELYGGIGFRSRITEVSGYSAPSKSFGFSASLGTGQEINYAPAPGLVPFLGDLTELTLATTWRPAERLRIDGFYLFERLAQPGSPSGGGTSQRTIFDNHLARLKLNYQFTRALWIRHACRSPVEGRIDSGPGRHWRCRGRCAGNRRSGATDRRRAEPLDVRAGHGRRARGGDAARLRHRLGPVHGTRTVDSSWRAGAARGNRAARMGRRARARGSEARRRSAADRHVLRRRQPGVRHRLAVGGGARVGLRSHRRGGEARKNERPETSLVGTGRRRAERSVRGPALPRPGRHHRPDRLQSAVHLERPPCRRPRRAPDARTTSGLRWRTVRRQHFSARHSRRAAVPQAGGIAAVRGRRRAGAAGRDPVRAQRPIYAD